MNRYADLLGARGNLPIYVGRHAITGRKVFRRLQDFCTHLVVVGRSRCGKSRWILGILQQFVDAGIGFFLSDPHGPLFQSVLAYFASKNLTEKVIIIDPDDLNVSVGINYIGPPEYPGVDVVGLAVGGLARTLGERNDNYDERPLIARWFPNAVGALHHAGHPLIDMGLFLTSPQARYRILGHPDQPRHLLEEWRAFERMRPQDAAFVRDPLLNRWSRLNRHPGVRRMLGQARTTISFKDAIANGVSVLCNWGATSLAADQRRLLHRMCLDLFLQAAYRRPPDVSPPYACVIDEFGWLAHGNEEELARAFGSLRKFGVPIIAATQTLSSMEGDTGGLNLLDEVLGNAGMKAIFSISRRDAEKIAADVFAAEYRDDIVNDAAAVTKFRPVESQRTVVTTSESETDSAGESAASGMNAGVQYSADDGIFTGPTAAGYTDSSSSSEGSFEGHGHTSSRSETTVPFYEFQEFRESGQVLSPEQLRERWTKWLVCQRHRFLQLQFWGDHTMPIVTPDVHDPLLFDGQPEQFKRGVYGHVGALPGAVADREIDERHRILESIPSNHDEEEPEYNQPVSAPAPLDEPEKAHRQRMAKRRAQRKRERHQPGAGGDSI